MKICTKCKAMCIVVRNGSEVCNQCGFQGGSIQVPDMKQPLITKVIDRANKIDGWMSDLELQWLADRAEEHELIVELGSYKGRSTRALGDSTKGKVVAIDHWMGEPHIGLSDEERMNLFSDFCSNLKDLIELGKVIPIKLDHRELTPNLDVRLDFHPDMVFIDGSHSYDDVKNDISVWYPEIQNFGLISGHDFKYPDVMRAVQELIPNCKLVEGTSIWYTIVVK